MSDLSKILLESEEVMQFLKKEMRLKEVYQQILFHKIIRQAAVLYYRTHI
ncbi:hypothetical protein [Nostoc sp. FACHB-190]|nr:hypothetical protein [Nostoc sp. FACHB-190]MBD2299310.1 hypothetical protein [Nostoc sp. FACHB-190]